MMGKKENWKTAGELQFVHDLAALLINTGQQPIMKAMQLITRLSKIRGNIMSPQ